MKNIVPGLKPRRQRPRRQSLASGNRDHKLFHAFEVLGFGWIDAYFLALDDEGRHRNRDAVFEYRSLVRGRGRRTLKKRITLLNNKLHRGWKGNSDRRAVIKLNLDF